MSDIEEKAVEAGCRAVYGSDWDGPPDKQPGPQMKEVWRNLVRKAIAAALREAEERVKGEIVAWKPIETAPKDGTVVLLYWPTMSITAYPAVGVHHGDEYGWEMLNWRDYGEVFPTHWMPLPAAPDRGDYNKPLRTGTEDLSAAGAESTSRQKAR